MKKLAILTSGGDAPGMNSCIRSLVRLAQPFFDEVVGVMHGFDGLLSSEFVSLTPHIISNTMMTGGTILKSSRSIAFRTLEGRALAKQNIDNFGITHLVVIGGNGTSMGMYQFSSEHQLNFVVIPSTIDNDTFGTELTLGHSTAINTIVEALDNLRTTSNSHERVFFVEVMGRDCGRLALESGIAGGAELILTPEVPVSPEEIIKVIKHLFELHKSSFTIVATEGRPSEVLQSTLQHLQEHNPKMVVLGHLQRGGSPVALDRTLATRFAEMAITLLESDQTNRLITINQNKISHICLSEAAGKTKGLDESLLSLSAKLML